MPITNDPNLLDIRPQARSIPPVAVTFGQAECDATYVDTRCPLPVREANRLSLIERLNREGEAASSIAESLITSFATPVGAGTALASPLPSGALAIGKALYVQSVHIASTTPIAGRFHIGGIQAGGLSSTNTPMMDVTCHCGPNFSATIPVNAFLSPAMQPYFAAYVRRWLDPTLPAKLTKATTTSGSPNLTGVTGPALTVGQYVSGTGIPTDATITAYDGGAGTATMSANATASGSNVVINGAHYVHVGLTGWYLADSLNFDAEKVIAFFGDSIWNGNAGPTTVTKCIPWLVNRYYREKGVDSRYIMVASVRSP